MSLRTRDIPEVPGYLRAARSPRRRPRSPSSSRPTAASPGRSASTSTSGTTSRRAMALLVGGEVAAAEAAYDWCLATPARGRLLADEDHRRPGRGRQRRHEHVGLPGGRGLAPLAGAPGRARSYAGCGRRSAAASTSWSGMQLPFGGIAWSQQGDGKVNEEALLAGSSSIYHSLRAGLALAEPGGRAAARLGAGRPAGSATRCEQHRDLFLDKSTFSMDWYYPVLGGRAARRAGRARPARRAGGTTSSSTGSAAAASTTTRGSPAPRPASW